MSELISEPEGYKKPVLSVGDEFISWSETYWKLSELFENGCKRPDEKGGEVCPYSVVRPIFIKKI